MSEYDPYDHPVEGYCPACGSTALKLSMGIPTCFQEGCPNPTIVGDILEDNEIHHIVRFGDGSFNAQHPLRERAGGSLLDCDIHAIVSDHYNAMGWPEDGTWRVKLTYTNGDVDTYEWERVDEPPLPGH